MQVLCRFSAGFMKVLCLNWGDAIIDLMIRWWRVPGTDAGNLMLLNIKLPIKTR